jgi:hypothetical protein
MNARQKHALISMTLKVLAAGLMVLVVLGCQLAKEEGVPRELMGVWGASQPPYADCALEITDALIIFKKGISHADINQIHKVKRIPEEGSIRYLIQYRNSQGGEFRLSLYYSKGPKGEVIQFAHQENVLWKKESKP